MSLTEAGELLLRMTHRVERDVEEALAEISQTHALQRGTLHLGGGMTVCLYILPRLLKKYRRLYPGVDLRVTAGSSEKILERVRAHEIDLGLLTLPIVARDMEVVPVLKEELVVVTVPGHPLSRERAIDPKSLGKFPLILYETGSNTRKVLDQYFLEEEISAPVAMEIGERRDHQGDGGHQPRRDHHPVHAGGQGRAGGPAGLLPHPWTAAVPRDGLGLPQDRAPPARPQRAAARVRRDEGPVPHEAGGGLAGAAVQAAAFVIGRGS